MKLNTSDSYKIMAKEIIYLTAEGYKKLRDELDHMRSVERPAISAAIAEARDKGDLSENAEYDAAREAQGMLEMRIAKLEDSLANARVIDESKIDKSKVQILSKVTLLNHNTKKEMVYTIVAEHEANLREGKLAIGTPWRCPPERSTSRSSTSAFRRPFPQGSGAASSAPGRVQDTTYIPICGYFCRTVLCGPFFVLLLAAER